MPNPNIGPDGPSPAGPDWSSRIIARIGNAIAPDDWLDRYHQEKVDDNRWLISKEVMQFLLITGYVLGGLAGLCIGIMIGLSIGVWT